MFVQTEQKLLWGWETKSIARGWISAHTSNFLNTAVSSRWMYLRSEKRLSLDHVQVPGRKTRMLFTHTVSKGLQVGCWPIDRSQHNNSIRNDDTDRKCWEVGMIETLEQPLCFYQVIKSHLKFAKSIDFTSTGITKDQYVYVWGDSRPVYSNLT